MKILPRKYSTRKIIVGLMTLAYTTVIVYSLTSSLEVRKSRVVDAKIEHIVTNQSPIDIKNDNLVNPQKLVVLPKTEILEEDENNEESSMNENIIEISDIKEIPLSSFTPSTIETTDNTPEGFVPYDVPLSDEIQMFLYEQCKFHDVPYTLALAIIHHESDFRSDVISVTNDYGLMQINISNHSWLRKLLEIEDFLDPKDNIIAGIHMISTYLKEFDRDYHKALMAYNYGIAGATKKWNQGIYSNKFSEAVVKDMENFKPK